ncbi:hypothetical protein PENSPDRAFT_668452 [Peniophora sp. CONT]|nr:hypothetical protein PENSPDRAFT_668452 [Peniophora sp. CONT]
MADRIRAPTDLLQQKDDALKELFQLTEELLARTRNAHEERMDDIRHARGDVQQHQFEVGRLLAELGQMKRMAQLVRSLRTIADHECNIWENVHEVNETYQELMEELPQLLPSNEPSSAGSASPSSTAALELSPSRKRSIREGSDDEMDSRPRKRKRLTLDLRSPSDLPTNTRLASLSTSPSSSLLLRYPDPHAPPRHSSRLQIRSPSLILLHSDSKDEPSSPTLSEDAPSDANEPPCAISETMFQLTSPIFRPTATPSLAEIARGARSRRPLSAALSDFWS